MNPPRTYVISLPETAATTGKCATHFANRGFTDYEFFNGIHGERFGLRTIWHYDVDNPGSGFMIGGKTIGIWLSHYMLWAALNMRGGGEEHFGIMEDDAVLPEDWEHQMRKAMAGVPEDFDMLYLGSCACQGHAMERVRGNVFHIEPPAGPQCLHSHVVAKKALPTLLETQRKVYAPIDASLVFHSHPLLKVYVVLPAIVDQWDTVFPP